MMSRISQRGPEALANHRLRNTAVVSTSTRSGAARLGSARSSARADWPSVDPFKHLLDSGTLHESLQLGGEVLLEGLAGSLGAASLTGAHSCTAVDGTGRAMDLHGRGRDDEQAQPPEPGEVPEEEAVLGAEARGRGAADRGQVLRGGQERVRVSNALS